MIKKIIFLLVIFLIPITSPIYAESVPDWVKNTAGWWATDAISETEFVNAIQFLVNEGIIEVESSSSDSNSESTPDWVKNTAGWWATDAISETEFVNAIQFLVNEGIINTKTEFSSQNDVDEFFGREISFIPRNELVAEINSQGLRGPEFVMDKPNDVYRIIAVGGSTTFGLGVEDSFSWPTLLQKSLNDLETSKRIEVINAGVSAATSLQNMNHINQKLINFSPDLIILYEGTNDMGCMLPYFHNDNTKWDNNSMLRLCGDYELDKYPELLAERFSSLCLKGTKNNFDVIVILQPNVELKSKILTNQELESYFDRPQNRVMLEDYELMKEYAVLNSRECNSVNDFTGIFDEYDIPLYFDYHHTGNLGNQIISEHIRDLTTPVLFEKGILDKIPNDLETVENFKFNLDRNYSNSDYAGQDLKEESFFGADLSGSNFEKSNLSNADLRLADLRNVNFSDSIIDDIKLRQNIFDGASFENVDFTNVDLENVDLSYTNLQNSKISEKNLERTHLYKADLRGADLSSSKMKNGFLNDADLSSANLTASFFSNINFSTIKDKSLENSMIDYANFAWSDFRGVKLPKEMFMSNFFEANMQEINLKDRIIHGAVFDSSKLTGANFDNADLSGVNKRYTIEGSGYSPDALKQKITPFPVILIIEAVPSGGNTEVEVILYNHFYGANLENASFVNTNLTWIDFTNANLRGANLTNADLSNAYLVGADLTGANLTNADLTGANLTDAIMP
tara:strand:- start:35 stop:2254 length:2220 start_codon:yes stop_codon:yes gene_type:complete